MFEDRIQEAKDIIRRQRICESQGVENTSERNRVRHSEAESWYEGTGGMIKSAFGAESSEYKRWKSHRDSLGDHIEEAIRKSPHGSPFEGYIGHLRHSIALLNEFDAALSETERSQSSDDPLLLQPNIFGLGLDLKKVIPWFKKKVIPWFNDFFR